VTWIFNSTPLIYLSKVSLSWIFEELEGEKIIPRTIYFEVVILKLLLREKKGEKPMRL